MLQYLVEWFRVANIAMSALYVVFFSVGPGNSISYLHFNAVFPYFYCVKLIDIMPYFGYLKVVLCENCPLRDSPVSYEY